MGFAPQRRAILRDGNVKTGSEAEVNCAFWLASVLQATAACEFSTSELQKAVRCWGVLRIAHVLRATAAWHFCSSELRKWLRSWGVLYILTRKCASHHRCVPFFILLLNSYLRTRRFSEAIFRTAGTTHHWKNTAMSDFIWRVRICVLLTRLAWWSSVKWLYSRVEFLSSDFTRVLILCRRTLLFNCPYCRKLNF